MNCIGNASSQPCFFSALCIAISSIVLEVDYLEVSLIQSL